MKVQVNNIMRNLHNSFWIKADPLQIAQLFDCQIIEADIIKGLKLSHSWRPFGWFTYGNLEDRYLKNFPKGKTLYMEFKTGSKSIQKPLIKLLKEYEIDNILVHAKDRNWFMRKFCKREENLTSFIMNYFNELHIIRMEDFKMIFQVEQVDLFKKSIFHF